MDTDKQFKISACIGMTIGAILVNVLMFNISLNFFCFYFSLTIIGIGFLWYYAWSNREFLF